MPRAKRAPKKAATKGQVSGPVISGAFYYEYVTSSVGLLKQATQADGIGVHVVNDSAVVRHTRLIIYHNTGAGAVVSADSGVVAVAPTWSWGSGFTVPFSGEYWVRIAATSDVLVPRVEFERYQGGIWVPFVTYRPGDFAVFRLLPTRQRLW